MWFFRFKAQVTFLFCRKKNEILVSGSRTAPCEAELVVLEQIFPQTVQFTTHLLGLTLHKTLPAIERSQRSSRHKSPPSEGLHLVAHGSLTHRTLTQTRRTHLLKEIGLVQKKDTPKDRPKNTGEKILINFWGDLRSDLTTTATTPRTGCGWSTARH